MTDPSQRLTEPGRPMSRAIAILADAALIVAAFALAVGLVRAGWDVAARPVPWLGLLPVAPATLLLFHALGLYRAAPRPDSRPDSRPDFGPVLGAIALGACASALGVLGASYLLGTPLPPQVPALQALLLVCGAAGLRLAGRGLRRRAAAAQGQPVLVYGAAEAGRQVVAALRQGRDHRPAAFIDDNPALQGRVVAGLRVYPPAQAEALVARLRPAVVVLAMPDIDRARRYAILRRFEPLGVAVRPVPAIGDIVAGRTGCNDLPGISPEHLLGRDPVPPRADLMGRNITGKVVLVTGAGGSIGSELCCQIIRHDPAALLLLDVSEFALYRIHAALRETLAQTGRDIRLEALLGSVQNPGRMRTLLRLHQVQTVYHAAAYKHVGLVEANVVEGIRNNVFGTQVIAEAAAETGVESFILISTDKAVRPTGVMGASKRMAELVCQALARAPSAARTTFSTVRFGNVLCSSGSVIPLFQDQIARGGPVTVRHREVTRFFMTIPEAAQLVIQAGAMARGGDVFVLDMGEPVRILDLACAMVRLGGLKPYVLGEGERPDPARGDIAVQIVGLNKGEKLHEELLIGNDPQGTDHPRIMTATEVALDRDTLQGHLDRLMRACRIFDTEAIGKVLVEAPLAFQPAGAAAHDLVRRAASGGHDAEPARGDTGARTRAALKVIRGAE